MIHQGHNTWVSKDRNKKFPQHKNRRVTYLFQSWRLQVFRFFLLQTFLLVLFVIILVFILNLIILKLTNRIEISFPLISLLVRFSSLFFSTFSLLLTLLCSPFSILFVSIPSPFPP